jgi:dynein heavy chain
MILNNVHRLQDSLFGVNNVSLSKKKPKDKKNDGPLFKISAHLSAPEIVVSPMANDIYKMLVRFIKNLVYTARQFNRWQHGSCIMAQPQIVNPDEDPIVYSFYQDVVANTVIMNSMVSLNNQVLKRFTNLSKSLDEWRKYRPLWKVDKVSWFPKQS